MEQKDITLLAANCLFIKGVSKHLIIDFQNNEWYHVDFKLLTNGEFGVDTSSLDKTDLDYLLERQILIKIPQELKYNFPPLSLGFNVPSDIEYGIIDRNKDSLYSIISTLNWFDKLLMKFCQIRFYNEVVENEIISIMDEIEESHIESIEFLLPYSENLENFFVENLKFYPKINSIVFHSSDQNLNELENYAKRRLFLKEQIISSDSCGKVHPSYFSSTKKHILKSINYNSCLYKKIGIDVNGEIKNCPSMKVSLGNVNNLHKITLAELETEYWSIKKDDIEICKDCEFRYICSDCRIQVEHKYARPNTCIYNPYTNKWKGQAGYENPSLIKNAEISNL